MHPESTHLCWVGTTLVSGALCRSWKAFVSSCLSVHLSKCSQLGRGAEAMSEWCSELLIDSTYPQTIWIVAMGDTVSSSPHAPLLHPACTLIIRSCCPVHRPDGLVHPLDHPLKRLFPCLLSPTTLHLPTSAVARRLGNARLQVAWRADILLPWRV